MYPYFTSSRRQPYGWSGSPLHNKYSVTQMAAPMGSIREARNLFIEGTEVPDRGWLGRSATQYVVGPHEWRSWLVEFWPRAGKQYPWPRSPSPALSLAYPLCGLPPYKASGCVPWGPGFSPLGLTHWRDGFSCDLRDTTNCLERPTSPTDLHPNGREDLYHPPLSLLSRVSTTKSPSFTFFCFVLH